MWTDCGTSMPLGLSVSVCEMVSQLLLSPSYTAAGQVPIMKEELQTSSDVPTSSWVWCLGSVEKREGKRGALIYSVVSMNHLHSGRALLSLSLALLCLRSRSPGSPLFLALPQITLQIQVLGTMHIPFQGFRSPHLCPVSFREAVGLGNVPEEVPSCMSFPPLLA